MHPICGARGSLGEAVRDPHRGHGQQPTLRRFCGARKVVQAPRTHAQSCPSPLSRGQIWERGKGGEEDRLGNRTGLQSGCPSWSTLTIPSLRKRSKDQFVGRWGEGKNRCSDLLDLVFLLSRNPFPSNSMNVEKVSGREVLSPPVILLEPMLLPAIPIRISMANNINTSL